VSDILPTGPPPPWTRLRAAQAVAARQADDEALWFEAETASEAYLQQALRELHEAIEGKTSELCAREAVAAAASPAWAPPCVCDHRADRHRDDGDPRGGGCWECSCDSYSPVIGGVAG
jgi:hypothetical protein